MVMVSVLCLVLVFMLGAREGSLSMNEAMRARGDGDFSFTAADEGSDEHLTNVSVIGWSDLSTDSSYSRGASDPTTEDVGKGGRECVGSGASATTVVSPTQKALDDFLEYVWSGLTDSDKTLDPHDEPLVDVHDDGVRFGSRINTKARPSCRHTARARPN